MGLRDLFPGYYLPTKSDLETIWENAIFVFDTNVLLHIYRYSPSTRDELFDCWEFVQERIWIPHQVAKEFQENRLTIVATRRERYRLCRDLLGKSLLDVQAQLKKDFESKTKDPNPSSLKSMWDEVLSKIDFQRLSDDYQSAIAHLDLLESDHQLPDQHGRTDVLRDRLDRVFGENVGSKESDEIAAKQFETAQSRCALQIPPGYCDSVEKDSIRSTGDGVIWQQILDYAKLQQKPIVFVSDETKEDWCWKPDARSNWGARPELIHEMREVAGMPFVLSSAKQFMEEVVRLRLKKEHVEVETHKVRDEAVKAALAEAQAIQDEESAEQNGGFDSADAFFELQECETSSGSDSDWLEPVQGLRGASEFARHFSLSNIASLAAAAEKSVTERAAAHAAVAKAISKHNMAAQIAAQAAISNQSLAARAAAMAATSTFSAHNLAARIAAETAISNRSLAARAAATAAASALSGQNLAARIAAETAISNRRLAAMAAASAFSGQNLAARIAADTAISNRSLAARAAAANALANEGHTKRPPVARAHSRERMEAPVAPSQETVRPTTDAWPDDVGVQPTNDDARLNDIESKE